MMSWAGVPSMCISVSDLFPVPGFHMQLHQSLQVSHLGISLWGIAVVLQPLEVERTFCQRLAFSLVQLTSNVDKPGWEKRGMSTHTQTGRVQISPKMVVCCIKLWSWPQKECEPVRVTNWIWWLKSWLCSAAMFVVLTHWQHHRALTASRQWVRWSQWGVLIWPPAYQFAWFSHTPHIHYAFVSEDYWKGNSSLCAFLAVTAFY